MEDETEGPLTLQEWVSTYSADVIFVFGLDGTPGDGGYLAWRTGLYSSGTTPGKRYGWLDPAAWLSSLVK